MSWNKKAIAVALTAALFLSFTLATTRATTLLDPLPENSSTQFGYALVSPGDINGDGAPDLAVSAPFQDGDFVSVNMSYGRPQKVGKIFLLDGATLAVLNTLNDPEFELIQPDYFGGLVGNSLCHGVRFKWRWSQ